MCVYGINKAFLVAQMNPPAMQGDTVSIPGSRRALWRRAWQSTPVFLPGESHGQRSLVPTVHRVTESWIQLSD